MTRNLHNVIADIKSLPPVEDGLKARFFEEIGISSKPPHDFEGTMRTLAPMRVKQIPDDDFQLLQRRLDHYNLSDEMEFLAMGNHAMVFRSGNYIVRVFRQNHPMVDDDRNIRSIIPPEKIGGFTLEVLPVYENLIDPYEYGLFEARQQKIIAQSDSEADIVSAGYPQHFAELKKLPKEKLEERAERLQKIRDQEGRELGQLPAQFPRLQKQLGLAEEATSILARDSKTELFVLDANPHNFGLNDERIAFLDRGSLMIRGDLDADGKARAEARILNFEGIPTREYVDTIPKAQKCHMESLGIVPGEINGVSPTVNFADRALKMQDGGTSRGSKRTDPSPRRGGAWTGNT